MAALLLAAALAAATTAAPQSAVTLSDAKLSATFDGSGASFGALTAMKAANGGASVLDPAAAAAEAVWSASFVGSGTGAISISSITAKCSSTATSGTTATAATFKWSGCAVAGHGPTHPSSLVDVTLDVVLAAGLLESTISFDGDGSVSLWDYTVGITGVKTSATVMPVQSAARQRASAVDQSLSTFNLSPGTSIYLTAGGCVRQS